MIDYFFLIWLLWLFTIFNNWLVDLSNLIKEIRIIKIVLSWLLVRHIELCGILRHLWDGWHNSKHRLHYGLLLLTCTWCLRLYFTCLLLLCIKLVIVEIRDIVSQKLVLLLQHEQEILVLLKSLLKIIK